MTNCFQELISAGNIVYDEMGNLYIDENSKNSLNLPSYYSDVKLIQRELNAY